MTEKIKPGVHAFRMERLPGKAEIENPLGH